MVTTPAGYDFDIVYPHHLAAMTWRDGALTLPTGPTYRVLMLPANWTADLTTLRRLRDFARAGAPIFGAAPVAPAGVRDYEARSEFAALVRELWDGASPLIRQTPLSTALKEINLAPDVVLPAAPEGGELRFIHRRTPDAEIYFVFNHSDRDAAGDFTFRVTGRQPELWNAITGARADASAFRPSAAGTIMPLHLEPRGSIFVVFRRAAAGPARRLTAVNAARIPPHRMGTWRESA
jgi:hypothetical protein